MEIHIVGHTVYVPPESGPDFASDASDGSAVAEFAGRACYQSWSKPNPRTATNRGYLDNIIRTGHFSVLEHGSVTFYIQGVSRALTHELIRHRHLSFSQLSQRFVNEDQADIVYPPAIRGIAHLEACLDQVMSTAKHNYEDLVEALAAKGMTRKQAREAARSVLPNATETKIVVTGNHRAWRHFIDLRATEQADAEIRELAVMILRDLRRAEPNIYQDYEITTTEEGYSVAHSRYSERS